MELATRLKNTEAYLSTTCDKLAALKGRLDDLAFRAQRIANAAKNNQPNSDTMFGTDLQNFRKELRQFAFEVAAIPTSLAATERLAAFDNNMVGPAQAVMRQANRLAQAVRHVHDTAIFAQHHIRASDHKVHAFYIVQEIEDLATKAQSLPTTANKIVIRVSTADAPPPPSAPKPAPPGA